MVNLLLNAMIYYKSHNFISIFQCKGQLTCKSCSTAVVGDVTDSCQSGTTNSRVQCDSAGNYLNKTLGIIVS